MSEIIEVNELKDGIIEYIAKHSDEIQSVCSDVGDSFKIIQIVNKVKDIPSKLFASKLTKFLNGINDISLLQRQTFIEKFGKEFESKSERLLNIINKIDDDKKIDYLVNIFKALVNEKIDLDLFFRFSHCVEQCVSEDLRFLVEQNITDENSRIEYCNNYTILNLNTLGIIKKTGLTSSVTLSELDILNIPADRYQYNVSEFGLRLRNCILLGE